ncbi:hypothetical protein [Nocardioides sp. HB32]
MTATVTVLVPRTAGLTAHQARAYAAFEYMHFRAYRDKKRAEYRRYRDTPDRDPASIRRHQDATDRRITKRRRDAEARARYWLEVAEQLDKRESA